MSEIQSEIAPTRLHHSARPGGVPRYLLEGKVPERAALLMIGEERSYGDLTAASIAVARWLVGSGGRKGDRALIVAENGYFWVAAYLGTLSAGMVAVPLPPTIDDEDLSYVIEYTEPRAAFVERRLVRRVGNHLGGIPLLTDALIPSLLPTPFADGENRRWDAVDAGLPPVVESDLASLLFTSGSTGRPRGVMLSHGNIIANADSIIAFLGLTGKDRVMAVLPFHYCFGTSLLHTHLRVGGTLVIERRFMYPEKVLERMRETKCTGFAGVPSHYQVLLRRSSLKKMSFPHLRYVQQAGGHLAPAYIRELREALPSAQIFIMYGQTEATARLAYLPPDMIDAKAGSIGKAIPGVELRIVNEAGQPIRPGEIGEIVAEGKNIAKGYWRAEEETASRFRDGKLYTGDLATVDNDGFIFIVGRASDFLKCGGKRVACTKIEEVLLDFDGLVEAAVVSMPDDLLGEAAKAFVVPRSGDIGNLQQKLSEFCKRHLPLPFIPKQFVVIDSLPKNTAGKVLKSNLR